MLYLQNPYFAVSNLKLFSMKKLLVLATAAFLVTGVAFAGDGKEKKCDKNKKECCKKGGKKSCCKKDGKKEEKAEEKAEAPKS